MTTDKTGWESERRTHFDEIVVNYDKIRPTYPPELYKDIFDYAGAGRIKKSLEIGTGTGKATVPFIEAGCDVTAVEIGVNMAEFLTERFKDYKKFSVITNSFEDVELDDNSYDLIYAASAFHWVDAEIGCPKAFRLLKNGGVFALMRYNVITSDGDELYEEIAAVKQKYYYSYYTAKERLVRHSAEELRPPIEIFYSYGFDDMSKFGFQDVTLNFYEVTLTYTADEYIALLDTLSDHRELPTANRLAMYEETKAAINKHGGLYNSDHVFQLYMGRKNVYS
jgi:Methylase involved in ubiquinone/menaquinone biosynthesis